MSDDPMVEIIAAVVEVFKQAEQLAVTDDLRKLRDEAGV